jgi:hypothetical protein
MVSVVAYSGGLGVPKEVLGRLRRDDKHWKGELDKFENREINNSYTLTSGDLCNA